MKRQISHLISSMAVIASFLFVGAMVPSGVAQAASTHPAFPVKVKTADGSTTITQRPTRILSLSASATQMLYAVGAGQQVVGVDKYSSWPPHAPVTKFSGYETSAEGYLRLRPDLVILAFNTSHLVEQLRKLHVPTLLLPPATTLSRVDAQMRAVGRATGHVASAAKETSKVNRDLNKVAASVGSSAKGTSYYVELDPTLYSATSHTFIGALFDKLGMVNIADQAPNASSGYPQLSAEYLVAANPQYVFLADTQCCSVTVSQFDARAGYATMSAVTQRHVYALSDSTVSQWGPHSLEVFSRAIAKIMGHVS